MINHLTKPLDLAVLGNVNGVVSGFPYNIMRHWVRVAPFLFSCARLKGISGRSPVMTSDSFVFFVSYPNTIHTLD